MELSVFVQLVEPLGVAFPHDGYQTYDRILAKMSNMAYETADRNNYFIGDVMPILSPTFLQVGDVRLDDFQQPDIVFE